MTIVVRGPRPRRRRRAARGARPSVREVCLLGRMPSGGDWAEGAHIEWDGRPYRVAAAQGMDGEGESRYVHLVNATAGDGSGDVS